jgi:hypothetical protein
MSLRQIACLLERHAVQYKRRLRTALGLPLAPKTLGEVLTPKMFKSSQPDPGEVNRMIAAAINANPSGSGTARMRDAQPDRAEQITSAMFTEMGDRYGAENARA